MLTCSYLFLQNTTLFSSFSLDGGVEAQSEEGGPAKTQGQCWHKSPMPKPVLWRSPLVSTGPEKGVSQWCPDASVGREAGPPNAFKLILSLLLFIPCLCNFLIT